MVVVAVAAVMIIVKKINKCNEKMKEKRFSFEEPCACTIFFSTMESHHYDNGISSSFTIYCMCQLRDKLRIT